MKQVMMLGLFLIFSLCLPAQITFDVRCICSPDQATGGIETKGAPPGAAYSWSGPQGFSSTNPNIFGLEEVGLYALVVTLPDGTSLHFQQEVDYCFEVEGEVQEGSGDSGFKISVQVSGEGAFHYAWHKFSKGAFVPLGVKAPHIGGLMPGYYSVEILQEKTGCRVFESFTLEGNGRSLVFTARPRVEDSSWEFRFNSNAANEGKWRVEGPQGQLLQEGSIRLKQGLQEWSLALPSDLPEGRYKLEIRQGEDLLLAVPVIR